MAYAIIDLLSAPIVGQVRPTFSQAPALSPQIVGIVFALAPVALVFYLARRDGEGLQPFGLGTARLPSDAAWGAVLAVLVSSVGLVIYVVSVRQGLNRFIVPVPPTGFWWTIPILVLGALRAALLEEVILVGYLIRRLRQLGVAAAVAVGASALIRASYHLYQGWGGSPGTWPSASCSGGCSRGSGEPGRWSSPTSSWTPGPASPTWPSAATACSASASHRREGPGGPIRPPVRWGGVPGIAADRDPEDVRSDERAPRPIGALRLVRDP